MMTRISKLKFKEFIGNFQFRALFNALGWDFIREFLPIEVDTLLFELESVADKNGFRILVCTGNKDGNIPSYNIRLKIDKVVGRLYKEHLIIFVDKQKTKQTWQLLWNGADKVAKVYSTDWYKGQDPANLYQKTRGLIFTLDEQEDITIVDVRQRVANNFHQNNEKVTKAFYVRFKKEHTSFLSFIKGIDAVSDKDWYASLMLNRLMFCYFIQKKGFLNDEVHYLRERLKRCKDRKSDGKFYSFYRSFLLVLFHRGLNEPQQNPSIKAEIGRVPYLNGGLFDEHELEQTYTSIDIEDTAFEKIFDFFDDYNWHLDTRMDATGRDINPDVIGYIFEKYINERAQMGAYYTKEDITEYISKNSIIPWLFNETALNYPKAFSPDGTIWRILKESGDEYLYDALKHGIDEPLPVEIKVGIDEVNRRTEWNMSAPPLVALPTETWREVIERRIRYNEIRELVTSGAITHISDFVTYNLSIKSFAQNVIQQLNDPEFLTHFYKALTKITILDPTCGSGAFLFAAMNILEPLYEASLARMEMFIAESEKGNYKFFEEIVNSLKTPEHPSRQYFIYKSIILSNLYGVDIMREAVEIAKLRLFLKLVATVEADYTKPNLGLEPLPDIDFNIRSGNSLVGFATKTELEKGGGYVFDFEQTMPLIEEKCDVVAKAFSNYKEIQLFHTTNYIAFKKSKEVLREKLKELNNELNKLLHKQSVSFKYDDWLTTHQPFHWFAEFYDIIHENGGFDVIIGNPPYIDFKMGFSYLIDKTFSTAASKNLYSLVLERCFKIGKAMQGYIVPISATSTEGFLTLQKLLLQTKLHISTFDDRPSHLFDGLDKNTLAILLLSKSDTPNFFTTDFIRWNSVERPFIFQTLKYESGTRNKLRGCLPKIGNPFSVSIWEKVFKVKTPLSIYYSSTGSYKSYYSRKINSFLQCLDFVPEVYDGKGELRPPSEFKILTFNNQLQSKIAYCLLNSSLFKWFIDTTSDGSHLNKREIDSFPINLGPNSFDWSVLITLADKLTTDLTNHSEFRTMSYKHDTLTIQCIIPKFSKAILNQIDKELGSYYQFSAQELDFIINHSIKYRMGKDIELVSDALNSKRNKKPVSKPPVDNIKSEAMKEFTVHEGIYFVNDVVDYTGLAADKVRLWFKELVREDYEGMSGKEHSNVDRLRISFHGLVEFVVIAALRELGFKAKKIFKARADLGAKTGKIYPFATNDVARLRPILHHTIPAKSELTFDFSSGNVSLNGLGQYNLEFVREFFSHIEFTNGYATKIFGNIDSQLIVIDPLQMSGKACINRKNVEAQVIAMQYDGEPSIVGIQAQYDVTKEEILEAVEYWNNN